MAVIVGHNADTLLPRSGLRRRLDSGFRSRPAFLGCCRPARDFLRCLFPSCPGLSGRLSVRGCLLDECLLPLSSGFAFSLPSCRHYSLLDAHLYDRCRIKGKSTGGKEFRFARRCPFSGVKRTCHAPLFAFNAFSALAQPTLTSSLCCFRHATILPPPGATPGHILSASALQRARGVAALAARIDFGSEITASESKETAIN